MLLQITDTAAASSCTSEDAFRIGLDMFESKHLKDLPQWSSDPNNTLRKDAAEVPSNCFKIARSMLKLGNNGFYFFRHNMPGRWEDAIKRDMKILRYKYLAAINEYPMPDPLPQPEVS